MDRPTDIFEWLDIVRNRRSMFVQSVSDLEQMIHGYYTALGVHGIHENVPKIGQGHFGVWLRQRTGWSLSRGWAIAITENTDNEVDEQFRHFFSYVEEYRKIQPVTIATVRLTKENQPTGKRVKYGHDGLMDRPDEILAINYSPTSLHHLRHRYGDRYVDNWIMMLGDGSHETCLDDLMKWVADEFGVVRTQWKVSAT